MRTLMRYLWSLIKLSNLWDDLHSEEDHKVMDTYNVTRVMKREDDNITRQDNLTTITRPNFTFSQETITASTDTSDR